MLKNYLITAWKVFLRRKFFTFINLFGIALTLTVIMVVSAIADSYLFPVGPEKHTDRYRIVNKVLLTDKNHSYVERSQPGYKFLKDNVFRLKTPEIISINGGATEIAIFLGEQKLLQQFRPTDANYWRILDFEFVEGRPYTQDELEQGQFLAVINQETALEHFAGQPALGKTIALNNQRFKVIGVVKNVSIIERAAFSDIWVPYTTLPSTAYQQDLLGQWEAILYHSDPGKQDAMNEEYIHLLKNDVSLANLEEGSEAYSGAFSKLENLSRTIMYGGADEFSYKTGLGKLLSVISLLIIIFMLLPSINMINLNVSRILERASEIGVRKAFGASMFQLAFQFIIESILLSLIGGLLGFALSYFLLDLIAQSGFIPFAEFNFNLRVFTWGLTMILLFAMIAGVYPAIKMSRLNPVVALKGGA